MQENADKAEALLKALASRNRLMILCTLVEGEQSVGALAKALEVRESVISQHLGLLRRESVISQHLGLLRRDGLVQGRRDGQTIHYALAGENAKRLLTTLYEIFCTDDGSAPDPTG